MPKLLSFFHRNISFYNKFKDITKWIQGKHEIEIIDQYLRIKQKLVSIYIKLQFNTDTRYLYRFCLFIGFN